MAGLVLREDKNGLATLTLNRPERLNALTVPMFADLDEHVKSIAKQTDKIGLVVLRGAGKSFSAGHDLDEIAGGERPPRPHFFAEIIERLSDLPQPVITAVHGHCYTGSLELALAGDLIFVAQSAKFADTHGKWSLTPIWGMTQRLPRRVGKSKALEMVMTGRPYSGAEALAMGLADMCVADDVFDAELSKLTDTVLGNAWYSLQHYKRLLRETDGMSLSAGLAYEVYRSPGRGPDSTKRITAFLNKAKRA
jgi:enoyl-CoA hydratase